MDKISDLDIGRDGVIEKRPLVIPKGIDPEKWHKASKAKGLMKTTVTPGGSVLVDCPYCIIYWREKNPVDITRFVDRDGKKQVTVYCSKEHKLVFRSIDAWREERQQMGFQVRS